MVTHVVWKYQTVSVGRPLSGRDNHRQPETKNIANRLFIREDRDPLSRSYDDANRNYDPCCESKVARCARVFCRRLIGIGASAALKARGLNGGKAEGSSIGETVLGITVKIEDANRGGGRRFCGVELEYELYNPTPARFPSLSVCSV